MKYPLTNIIYQTLCEHKGGEGKIVGNSNTLRQMKLGNLNPTLQTIKKMFEENEVPAEIVVTVKKEGKKGKTKIKL